MSRITVDLMRQTDKKTDKKNQIQIFFYPTIED